MDEEARILYNAYAAVEHTNQGSLLRQHERSVPLIIFAHLCGDCEDCSWLTIVRFWTSTWCGLTVFDMYAPVVPQAGVKPEAQQSPCDDCNDHHCCNDKFIVVGRIVWSRNDTRRWSHGRAIEYLVLQTTKCEVSIRPTCNSYSMH